jgi:hypothetical protein
MECDLMELLRKISFFAYSTEWMGLFISITLMKIVE